MNDHNNWVEIDSVQKILGLVMIESIATGMAAIAINLGSLPEVITKGS